MEKIPQRELRNQSSEILRRVAEGESFTVTNHGQAVAVVRPYDARVAGLEPRVARPAFSVDNFVVHNLTADVLGVLLRNRESKR
jgi:prevent-host-death family protein